MKDLKMSKKIIVAFGVVIVCFVITVAVMIWGMSGTGNNYRDFYENTQVAISKAITVRVNLQKSVKNMAFATAENDAAEVQKYLDQAEEFVSLVRTDLEWFTKEYSGDKTEVQKFESEFNATVALQEEMTTMLTASDEDSLLAADELLLGEYGPQANKAAEVLLVFSDGLEAEAETVFNRAMTTQRIITLIAIIIAAVALIITINMALALIRSVVVPIREMEGAMKEMEAGSVNAKLEYTSKDEVGQLADSMRSMMKFLNEIIMDESSIFSEMGNGNFTVHSAIADKYVGDYSRLLSAMKKLRDNLNGTLTQINQAADRVAAGADQVSSGAQALAQGATEQASSVEELAATTNDISDKVTTNADNAKLANEKATVVKENADKSRQRMHEMLDAMTDINDKSGEVGKIIKTIEDIAFQTNILALNAAVEAARAGDAGKGFAVVADEVRNLAGKSAEASKNTSLLIEDSMQAVERGIRIANETAQSLDEVVDGVDDVSLTIGQITDASEEQATALQQVNQGVDQISSVVQTNSATAEQSAAASEELSEQSQLLKQLVGNFKLLDSGSGASYEPTSSSAPDTDNNNTYNTYDEPATGGNYYGDDNMINDKY